MTEHKKSSFTVRVAAVLATLWSLTSNWIMRGVWFVIVILSFFFVALSFARVQQGDTDSIGTFFGSLIFLLIFLALGLFFRMTRGLSPHTTAKE
jgi:heme O synthase-like polyprenyltransferase